MDSNTPAQIPQELPDWIVKYYKADYQSSAGKAIKYLFERLLFIEVENERLREALDEIVWMMSNQLTDNAKYLKNVAEKVLPKKE